MVIGTRDIRQVFQNAIIIRCNYRRVPIISQNYTKQLLTISEKYYKNHKLGGRYFRVDKWMLITGYCCSTCINEFIPVNGVSCMHVYKLFINESILLIREGFSEQSEKNLMTSKLTRSSTKGKGKTNFLKEHIF